MTLMQKFETFSPEQKEKLLALQSADQLDAFLAETKSEMSAEEKAQVLEYITSGIVPLDDDDMEAVAGGVQTKKNSEQQAEDDGRIYNVPPGDDLCTCNYRHKWAREVVKTNLTECNCSDVKCYKCGAVKGHMCVKM